MQTYLSPLLAAGIDQLVLGCTHYPFLRPLFAEVAGPEVEIIDPAPAVARQAGRVLAQHGWLAVHDEPPYHTFYTTREPALFRSSLTSLLGLENGVHLATWSRPGGLAAGPSLPG